MRFTFLFNGFYPLKKCGSDPVSALISGGFQLGSTALSADMSESNVNKQIAAQQRENSINRDWQTSEAEKARQWTAGQVQQQNVFTQQQAANQQQYNLQSMKQQAMYNSPVYQRSQLEAAGINPQVYFGQSSSFSGSSAQAGGAPGTPSPGSASTPGSVQGLSPVSYQPPNLRIPEMMSGLGAMMSGLANARKSGVETSRMEQTLTADVEKAFAEADWAKIQAALGKLDQKLREFDLPYKFKRVLIDYEQTVEKLNLTRQEVLSEVEEQDLKRATARMNRAIADLNDEQKNQLGVTIQYLPRMLESEILKNRGSAAAGFASAEESSVKAEQERIFNKIYNDRRYQHSIISQAVTAGQQAISQKKLTDSQVKHLNYMIEQAAYANDMKEFTYWSGQIQSYLGSVGEAASAFYGAGALRELVKMRQLSRMPATSVKGFK